MSTENLTISPKDKIDHSLLQSNYTSSDQDLFNAFETTSNRKVIDIDINTVLKVTNSITNETDLNCLVDKVLGHLMTNTGATRAVILFNDYGDLYIQKILNTDGEESISLKTEEQAPMTIINHVFEMKEFKIFHECPVDGLFAMDYYIQKFQPKAILCCPMKHQNRITGIIYLENRTHVGSFTATRVNLVKSLMPPTSIAISNAQLLQRNKELSDALKDSNLKRYGTRSKYSVDTPMQKVIDAINSIKNRFASGDSIHSTLDTVLSNLASDGLFAANLEEVNDQDGKGIDQDTKNWIESSLLMTNRGNTEDKSTIPRLVEKITFFDTPERLMSSQGEIDAMLKLSNTPEFDCFKLYDLTDGQSLSTLSVYILQQFRLCETFHLNPTTVVNFFQKIESSYNKLPFHNSIHATDVLQTVYQLLHPDLIHHFTPLELFSVTIASAIHDLDHPGINNNFLVQLNHPVAKMYNDIAVLESHHAARAFDIATGEMNIFESLTVEQYRQSRKMIISIVLATDLAQHFQFIAKFKGKMASALKMDEDGDRTLVMEMAVKCGDLGNPVKTFDQSKKWTNLVMEEFFRQGDREKMLGLPVSKFMDRNDTSISKCQIGFIDFLVAPLFDAWVMFSATEFTTRCLSNLAHNRSMWVLHADDADLLPGIPATEFERLDKLLDITIPTISFGKSFDRRQRALSGKSAKRTIKTHDSFLQRIRENNESPISRVSMSPI